MFCLSVNFLIVTRYLHSTAVGHSCHGVFNWCFCSTVDRSRGNKRNER